MARIKFTTDSAADISAALRKELDIEVLPFPIAMEDRELADGVDISPEGFYDLLLDAPRIPTHAGTVMHCFRSEVEGVTVCPATGSQIWATVRIPEK